MSIFHWFGDILKILCKKKKCQFWTWGNNCSWSKNKSPLKCGVFWSVVLTPCIPLPAKGYKETASTKELLANLFNLSRKQYTPRACSLVFCLQKGSLWRRSYSKWSHQHSSFTKHKKNSSRKLIHSCNLAFPFNKLPILVTVCSENDSEKLGKKYSDSKLKSHTKSVTNPTH